MGLREWVRVGGVSPLLAGLGFVLIASGCHKEQSTGEEPVDGLEAALSQLGACESSHQFRMVIDDVADALKPLRDATATRRVRAAEAHLALLGAEEASSERVDPHFLDDVLRNYCLHEHVEPRLIDGKTLPENENRRRCLTSITLGLGTLDSSYWMNDVRPVLDYHVLAYASHEVRYLLETAPLKDSTAEPVARTLRADLQYLQTHLFDHDSAFANLDGYSREEQRKELSDILAAVERIRLLGESTYLAVACISPFDALGFNGTSGTPHPSDLDHSAQIVGTEGEHAAQIVGTEGSHSVVGH
ncbi:MAG TPA: hypothetical protein VL588_08685 [Bdellovibrionota bacterium]|nr:hypothetical protein [Bdellovibrionota bacterium]